MLELSKYSREFQIKCWATCYNVYEFLAKNGELLAYENYPAPIVNYFASWIKKNK